MAFFLSIPTKRSISESQRGISSSHVTSDSDLHHTETTAHSESQEVVLHLYNGSATSQPRKDLYSTLVRTFDGIPSLRSWTVPRTYNSADITFPKVTISAFNETGQEESSIKVPLQRTYTGTKLVIPSSLANIPCATLGILGLLDQLNATLGTSHSLNTPSLSFVLEDCIKNKYDFGTAYSRLRTVWSTDGHGTIQDGLRGRKADDWKRRDNKGTIQDELHRREADDRKRRQKSLTGNRLVPTDLEPRRVWDLYANRVVPWANSSARIIEPVIILFSCTPPTQRTSNIWPISHAWMDADDRVNVQTPINGYEWPVPIPKDTNLDLIRIEMLNLGVEYTWLDVLCLRQKGGTCDSERLRVEEWKLDVPTIGAVYGGDRVVIYMSGLGRPLTLKEGDLQSDRCWFRRAWTVQEVGTRRIIAGDMPDGPLHAEPIDKDNTGILTEFHEQLQVIDSIHYLSQRLSLSTGMFGVLSEMQNRVSTNPVDKVAGVATLLVSRRIPAYHETESLEDAWTALVNVMLLGNRGELFFCYPEPGDAGKKWRPSWEQVMNKCLPVNRISTMVVDRDDETEEDWYEGLCVEKGFVRGLAVGSIGQDNRCGELIVKHTNGTEHTFSIIARHGYPIPEDTYTLLGVDPAAAERELTWIRWLNIDQAAVRSEIQTQYWVIGRKLPDEKFEKVSVFEMANEEEVERLRVLDIIEQRRTILV